jgi:hypothetical protein
MKNKGFDPFVTKDISGQVVLKSYECGYFSLIPSLNRDLKNCKKGKKGGGFKRS